MVAAAVYAVPATGAVTGAIAWNAAHPDDGDTARAQREQDNRHSEMPDDASVHTVDAARQALGIMPLADDAGMMGWERTQTPSTRK